VTPIWVVSLASRSRGEGGGHAAPRGLRGGDPGGACRPVAARAFVDAFGPQFLAAPGDGDDDRGVAPGPSPRRTDAWGEGLLAAVFARHGLDPGGRLSFDAFCVLALTLAKR